VFVATVSVPPDPVVMLRKAAAPVPPAAAFTLIATAPAVALVVVIAPPAFIVKPCAPAPSVLALIVIRLLPAPPSFALSPTAPPLATVMGPLPVEVAAVIVSVPVVLVRVVGRRPGPVAV